MREEVYFSDLVENTRLTFEDRVALSVFKKSDEDSMVSTFFVEETVLLVFR